MRLIGTYQLLAEVGKKVKVHRREEGDDDVSLTVKMSALVKVKSNKCALNKWFDVTALRAENPGQAQSERRPQVRSHLRFL